jgi:outer membrane protein
MRKPEAMALGCMVMSLAGCASHSVNMAPPAPNSPWTPATTPTGEIIAGAPASENARPGDSYVLPSNPKAAAGAAAPPELDKSHAYTLPELIDIAESHNPATRISWENARTAALAVGIAKAAYLPSLSASVVGAYQSDKNTVTALGTQTSGSSSAHGSISALSMQWLLFDFGERSANVAAAEQGSAIANISFTAIHQQIIYRVCLAYYAHAAAQARVTTADKALTNAKEVQAAAEARYAHEVGTTIEVAQARQLTAQAELGSVQAKGQEQDTYMALIGAMGISPLTQMTIAQLGQRAMTPDLMDPIQQIVTDALARRADVLSAFAAHQASLDRLKAAKAEFMPKIFLSGTASYSTNGFDIPTIPGFGQQPATVNIGGNNFGGTVILGLTIPIYDGGVRHALEHQALSEVARTDAMLDQVRDDATREIVTAGNGVKTSLAALTASRASASAAQVVFDASLDAYRNGVGSITDVTRAETLLLEANNASTDAYSQALTSAATLALSAGTLGNAPEQ